MYKSCWLDVKNVIKRIVYKGLLHPDMTKGDQYKYYEKKMFKDKREGDYTTIIFPNESIIYATQNKAWEEGLGAGYGWFWVDDAMECQESFFIGNNVSAGLLSRLRLPHVRFDKSTYDEEKQPHGLLHGMVSSNPPPFGHWLHKLFGNKPGIHSIGQDSITWLQTITTDNPFVGDNYTSSLVAVQQRMGHSENVVRRVIYGESIPAYKGIPVFPQFKHSLHVAPLKFRPDLPLIRSWDFGHDHPAVVFSNLYKCKYNNNHYFTLSEIVEAVNVTIYRLYENYVKPHTEALYKSASLIKDAGDRAGYRTSSSNKDGRSDMKILINEYHLPFQWRYMNLAPSLQFMRSLLEPKTPCKCGLPFILISNKCPALIGALEGGYHFPYSRNGVPGDKPVEDKWFADVACAWRYGAENYVHWGAFQQQDEQLQAIQRLTSNLALNNIRWLHSIDPPLNLN
jgi:hypothetical protein